jgi:hypothetical protein
MVATVIVLLAVVCCSLVEAAWNLLGHDARMGIVKAFVQQSQTTDPWNLGKVTSNLGILGLMVDDIQLPDELLNLLNVVEKCPEAFATGSKDIQAAALGATKFVFDLGAFF